MASFEDSRQIYDELVERSELHWLLGLLAFAMLEEQRIEWEKHVEQQEGQPPGNDEIRRWYRELPQAQLLRARAEAENALRIYAAEVWEEFRSTERDEVRNSIVVEEIRSAK